MGQSQEINKKITIELKSQTTPQQADTMIRKMIEVLSLDELTLIEGAKVQTTIAEITIDAESETYDGR